MLRDDDTACLVQSEREVSRRLMNTGRRLKKVILGTTETEFFGLGLLDTESKWVRLFFVECYLNHS